MKKKFSAILTGAFLILFCMVMSVTVNAAQKTPGRVKMVSAYSDPDVNQVHVTWDKTTNATEYVLFCKEVGTDKWEKVLSVNSSRRDCWLNYKIGEDVKVGKEYAWTVKGYNKNSQKYGAYDKKGISIKILPERALLSGIAVNDDKTGVILQWEKYEDGDLKRGDFYNIYRKQSGKWKKIAQVDGRTTTYTDTEYAKNKVNTYTVRVYDSKSKTLGNYNKTGLSIDLRNKTPLIVYNSTAKEILLKGTTIPYVYYNTSGKIKWSSSNKKVVQVVSTGKNSCNLKAVKEGTVLISAQNGNMRETFTVVVASGNDYINKWIQNIVKEVRLAANDRERQLLLVSQYIVSNFTYDNIFDMKTVISERKGNCYSAGLVMARIYQAMGYKATVRSAIHDKKSRYPSNMIMGSDHYNVEVIMNGRTYYLDATPGCGGVYLSSPKEVLESYIYSGNGWERIQ